MDASFELVVVAFLRSTGGVVRVLLAVDRNGEQLFDGEPALLASHRPGRAIDELELEGPDHLDEDAVATIASLVRVELATLVERAFDEAGSFDGQRILGASVGFAAAPALLDV